MRISMRGINGKSNSTKNFLAFCEGCEGDGSNVLGIDFYTLVEENAWFTEEVRSFTKYLCRTEGTRKHRRLARKARLEKLGLLCKSSDWDVEDLPF